MSDEFEVVESQDELLAQIKSHYDAGVELTDEEVDYIADMTINVIREILQPFGEGGVSIDEYLGDDNELIFDISEGDLAILIGRHGKTLDALQLVVSSIVNYQLGFHYPIVIDIEGYKNRRKSKVQSIALSAVDKVKSRGGSVRLPAMTPYERRLVQIALKDIDGVSTHSEGEDPDRYVVVSAK
jgi:spoIIIJ-associated protein